MLTRILDNLRAAAFSKFLIVTGYHAERIETYFSSQPGIEFVSQNPVNGTGSAALLVKTFKANEPFP